MDKNERITREQAVLDTLEQSGSEPFDKILERVAATLKENFPHYTGIYMYLLEEEMLVLGAFSGRPTEHTRIPVGVGICGRAARVKQTVTVDDVNADAEYIACSLATRSEVVVPIMLADRVLGEIDIDSDVPAAFTDQDRKFLEHVARRLAPRV